MSLRPLILCVSVILVLVAFYNIAPVSTTDYFTTKFRHMSYTQTWSSSVSGYLESATPYPNPHDYVPKRSALKLAVLRNAQIDQEGFTLAIFSDRVAIDSKGRVSTLTNSHYDAILQLVDETAALPGTEGFRNQWRVKHSITGRPIERILSPRSTLSDTPAEDYSAEYIETSVYGFDKQHQTLEKPTNGFVNLPPVLWELTGLALEAREGDDGEKDDVVLQKVRSILGNVF